MTFAVPIWVTLEGSPSRWLPKEALTAAHRLARLEDREGLSRAAHLQMTGRSDAGETGADDQNVDVLVGHGKPRRRAAEKHRARPD